MANASISGLGSGLDTAGIVNQFMQLEAIPQTQLKTRVSSEESAVKALQGINAKLAALVTKATDTGKADAWDSLTATSSLPGLTVSASTAGNPTSFSLTVDQVALSHQLGFASAAGLDDQVTGGSTTVLLSRPGSDPVEVATDGTLGGLVSALNDPANETGLRANAVRVADGSYQLLVESTATGGSSAFTLTAADGSDLLGGATVRAGQDAVVSLGAGITARSASNTFTDLLPGVTVTVDDPALAGQTTQVGITRDAATLSGEVKSMVDAINGVLTEIGTLTANGAQGATGRLPADRTLRSVANGLATAIYPADGSSMAQLGVQVDRYGKLTFDEAAFAKAYEADPAAVAAAFTGEDGFSARVASVARTASDPYDGTVSQAINNRNDGIARLQDSIEAWDMRLELRRSTLTRQFTALDVALATMNSQSTWIAGQINSLNATEG